MISIIIIEQLLNWSKGGKKKIWGKADSKMEHFSVCGFSMVQTVELLRIYSSARWLGIQTTSFQEYSFCKLFVELLPL